MHMSDTAISLRGNPPTSVPVVQPPTPSKTSAKAKEAIQEVTFGSIAGIIGKVIEYPFDTVKVRLQSQPNTVPLTYAGPLDCFKKSFQKDGLPGLYRGISAPLFGAAVETSSLFLSVSRQFPNYRRSN
jgi:ornithine carrier protein